ncbi:MAG TPA: carboxyltransferase [Methylomirabilota bacterium]|nr:carboxyltransferase [Methylomirabilota bacterium]
MTSSPATEIRFVDTTLRDGQESLWATGMRTGMILPIAAQMDEAGFEAIEIIATTNFKKQIRDLKENPWERIRLVAEKVKETPLRAVRNRYMAAFQITPSSISDLWLERMFANGVCEIRLSDPSNNAVHWKKIASSASKVGLKTIINLIFSISPRHSDAYYAEKTRAAAKLKPYRICFKDPGGLLTPEHTRELVPIILKNSDGIPAELHTHCNTGLGPLCCLEAVKLGITSLNTALPPLANGASNPSLFNVIKNLRAINYQSVIDEALLHSVSEHFASIARREGLPIGIPLEYEVAHGLHQVPGGMASNFRYQLGKAAMEHRLPEVLEEIGRVRAEFGYPIMVTPYSQFVGVQATMNIILGERYKEVPDEVIQYALGFWGEEESNSMNLNVKDKILNRPRARELKEWEPPQPSLKKVREQLGGANVSDDDLLLRYFSSEPDVAAMKAAGPPRPYFTIKHPLLTLLETLSTQDHRRQIYIRTREMSLCLEKTRINSDGRKNFAAQKANDQEE